MKKHLYIFCLSLFAFQLYTQNTFPLPVTGNADIGTISPAEELETYGDGASIKINNYHKYNV